MLLPFWLFLWQPLLPDSNVNLQYGDLLAADVGQSAARCCPAVVAANTYIATDEAVHSRRCWVAPLWLLRKHPIWLFGSSDVRPSTKQEHPSPVGDSCFYSFQCSCCCLNTGTVSCTCSRANLNFFIDTCFHYAMPICCRSSQSRRPMMSPHC